MGSRERGDDVDSPSNEISTSKLPVSPAGGADSVVTS